MLSCLVCAKSIQQGKEAVYASQESSYIRSNLPDGVSEVDNYAERRTHSAGGDVNHQSITPENAANAAPPPAIAIGPEFLANIAPVTNPPETAFVMSCFARYCHELYSV